MAKDQDKSSLQLAKEAQAEIQTDLNDKRIEMIKMLKEYESIGGEENVEESLMEIALAFPAGIAYPFLQRVFPEVALTKAREKLKTDGKILQIGKKGNVIIKPVILE